MNKKESKKITTIGFRPSDEDIRKEIRHIKSDKSQAMIPVIAEHARLFKEYKKKTSMWQLKNFTPRNIYYTVQGHYRKWIAQQYSKFNNGLATRILEFKDCLGTHPDCGCPMAEVLLSDKPYKPCK